MKRHNMMKKTTTTTTTTGEDGSKRRIVQAVRSDVEKGRGDRTRKSKGEKQEEQVFLKIKRKRREEALDTIIVENDCGRFQKNRRRDMEKALNRLSVGVDAEKNIPEKTESRRVVFKRVRTMDAEGPLFKRQRCRNMSAGSTDVPDRKEESTTSVLDRRGYERSPIAALNPEEIKMDRAVWNAFREKDFSSIFELITRAQGNVNFQRRASDQTTALMAAAFHGLLDVCVQLIKLGAAVELTNSSGETAADMAEKRNHTECYRFLRSRENIKKAKATTKRSNREEAFVYDIYRAVKSNERDCEGAVVRMNDEHPHAFHGMVCGRAVEELSEDVARFFLFEGEDDDKNASSGFDSQDSNAEGYYANDYPDEDTSSADENPRDSDEDIASDGDGFAYMPY